MPTAPWLAASFLRSGLKPDGLWSTFMDPANPDGAWSSELVAESFDEVTRARVLDLWCGAAYERDHCDRGCDEEQSHRVHRTLTNRPWAVSRS